MRWLVATVVLPLLGFGCSDDSPHPIDASRDSQVVLTLPDVPPGCPPDAGNENGIGAPCTATGSECPGSLQCSCKSWFGYTMPASMPCFCTTVVFSNTCSSCGSNASCCTYDIPVTPTTPVTVSACFPSVCLSDNECPVVTP
jgi:hypothetical protein